MVKSIISAIIGFAILILGSAIEYRVVTNSFNEFDNEVKILRQKIENETATVDDGVNVQNVWIEKKKPLHVLIPHNEIKEIDLWLSECCGLLETKTFDDALTKLTVVSELIEQIPKTFSFRIENIM